MKSTQNEVIYGLGFFAMLVGFVLLALCLVNDYTSTHFFTNSPYLISVAILAAGALAVGFFSKVNQKAH